MKGLAHYRTRSGNHDVGSPAIMQQQVTNENIEDQANPAGNNLNMREEPMATQQMLLNPTLSNDSEGDRLVQQNQRSVLRD